VKYTVKNVKLKANRVATTATIAAIKTVTKKVDAEFYVQYKGKEASKEFILDRLYEEWMKSHKLSEIKAIQIYLKVEEDTAYCLVNGEIKILFLFQKLKM